MAFGDASDYGNSNDQATLVPNALTCYRHFGLGANPSVELTPMNRTSSRDYSYVPEGGVFTATCQAFRSYGGCTCGMCRSARREETHASPNKECRCGFYAHYLPTSDFYPGMRWGVAPGLFMDRMPHGLAMVRAVVEMTGTVILGTKGVRAQKMRVKALAVDWEKYGYADWLPLAGERFMFETRAQAAATKYGAEYFDDPAAMYKAYPQQDLTALGVDPVRVEAEEAKREAERVRQMEEAAQELVKILRDGAARAARQASYAVGGFLPTTVVEALAPDGKPPATAFERVMEAKRSRPAPPGAGIDRRRGRLR